MGPGHVFVLNLDAELELASPRGYTPSEAVRRATRAHAATLLGSLVPPGTPIADASTPRDAHRGRIGLAWSPTPRALATLAHVGARPAPHPPLEVLRRVLRRDFAYVAELEGSIVVDDAERALAHLRQAPPLGDGWRLKRAIGMAGRGHRVVRGVPREADVAFVRASHDGLVIEPNVAVTRELALHGFLRADGRLARGTIREARVDRFGAWSGSAEAEVAAEVRRRLQDALDDVGAALHVAGYHGPFGLDAYLHSSDALRTRSETNARYSMGWAPGFGGLRPDLDVGFGT